MTSSHVGQCTVLVHVLDVDGAPVRGAMVMVTRSSGSHSDIAAITDDRGVVELDGLVPGPVLVEAHTEVGRSASGTVEADVARPATLALRIPAI